MVKGLNQPKPTSVAAIPPDNPAAITAAGKAQHRLAITPPIVPCPINANLPLNLISFTPIRN